MEVVFIDETIRRYIVYVRRSAGPPVRLVRRRPPSSRLANTATILSGPPLPPLIFIGSAITNAPVVGQLIQVSDILEAWNVRGEQNPVGVEGLRLSVVNARRVDPHRVYLALHQEARRRRIDAREVQLGNRLGPGLARYPGT